MDNVYMNLESAAVFMDASVHSLRRWIKSGLLKGYKMPSGTYRVTEADLIKFIEKGHGDKIDSTTNEGTTSEE